MQMHWDTVYSDVPESHRLAEVRCATELCKWLPKHIGVVEFFAGLGSLHDVFESELEPTSHYVCELDQKSVDGLLVRLSGSKTVVECGNAYVLAFPHITDGCLVSLDFNKYTILNLLQSKEAFWTLGHIATCGAKYIHLTDSAVFRMHLNAKAYTKHLGVEIKNIDDYFAACADKYFEMLGWTLMGTPYHRGAAHLLFRVGG